MGYPVVHFEISGADPSIGSKFYTELFGWQSQELGPEMGGYVLIDTHSGEGINGAVMKSDDGNAFIIFYVEVPSVKEHLERAESLGAKTLVPETEIPGIVTFGIFTDSDGNRIGLITPGKGPGVSQGNNPPVAWFEILGSDAGALQEFYSELFGWTIRKSDAGGIPYAEADTGSDRGIPGGIGQSPDGSAVTTLYARVDDLDKWLEKAESLGAKRALDPAAVDEGTSVAAFIDPQGALFGLWKRTD